MEITDRAVLAALPEGTCVRAGGGLRRKTHDGDEWDFVMDSAEVLVEGDGTVRALPAGPVPGAAIRDAAVLAAMPEGSAVRAGRGIRCKTYTADEWDMVMDSAEVLAEGRGVVFVLGGAETD